MDIPSDDVPITDLRTEDAMADPESGITEHVGEQGKRRKIILLIILNLALQMVMIQCEASHQASLVTTTNFMNCIHSYRMMTDSFYTVLLLKQKRYIRLGGRRIWRVQRSSPFADQLIFRSHTDKEFKRRLRVNPSTFYYICSLVASAMQKQKKGGAISLETRVALSLTRLGTRNYLLGCADLYGMSESLASIVVRQFCDAVIGIIRLLVVPEWTEHNLQRVAAEFEAKHDIPFIMGAIDGSHIPIIAPVGDAMPYYNRKGFHSVLLQGIVDAQTTFWDWDFGWAGSLHDYTMFVSSREGQKVMRGMYAPYKLIADAAYPYRTCMWVPFKGTKETMAPDRAHWNFIQSSTRMAVERAFGILKGRWRILLRRVEMPLHHLPALVGACICLHNLCVQHKDFFDDAMVEEAKKWLRQQSIASFGDLQEAGTMRVFDYSQNEIGRVHIDVDEIIHQNAAPNPHANSDIDSQNISDDAALRAGVTMHRQMCTLLFKQHLKRDAPLEHGLFESESSSDQGP